MKLWQMYQQLLLVRFIYKIIQSRYNSKLTTLNNIYHQAICYFFTSMTKPEWSASSRPTFLWSFMKIIFAIEKKCFDKLSYLHKFKMDAHDFHLVRLCIAT